MQALPVERAAQWRLAAVLVLVLAMALRVPSAGEPPPGLYRDEAYNGTDALGVLAGQLHVFFPANNGREPLFVYLAAPLVAALGRSPLPLRLTSALVGTAAVAAAMVLSAALFGRAAGWLAGLWLAVAPWPTLLSRVGLRAGLLPLVLALGAAASLRGARRGDRRWLALGGAMAGLALYTYVAAWAALGLVAGYLVWRAAAGHRPVLPRGAWTFALAALVVALPLLAFYAGHPGAALGRVTQVAVGAGSAGGAVAAGTGSGLAALAQNAARALGLFVWRGDAIARHNIPGRPLLGPLGAAFWLAGFAWLLGRARRSAAAALTLGWLGCMLLPTALAQGAPHFLRAVGVLPLATLPAALGVVRLQAAAARCRPRLALAVTAAGLLAVGADLAATVGYLATPAVSPLGIRLYYDFEAGATALAADVNRALGAAGPSERGAVWLDRRLRDGWASVPYLVPTEELVLTDPYDPVLTTGPGTAFLQPEVLDLPRIWSRRAPALRLSMRLGTLERGDLESVPRRLYIAVEATAARPVTEPLGTFANGLLLLGRTVRPAEGGLTVETEWALAAPVDHDVTAFVQLVEGDALLAGSDAPLGQGWLPVPYWRPGDRVLERRTLELGAPFDPARQSVIVGLYERPSVDRIAVRLADGRTSDVVLVGGAEP